METRQTRSENFKGEKRENDGASRWLKGGLKREWTRRRERRREPLEIYEYLLGRGKNSLPASRRAVCPSVASRSPSDGGSPFMR